MATLEKSRTTKIPKKQTRNGYCHEPKQLSKAGQWLRNNPGGIFIVNDWKAVNK